MDAQTLILLYAISAATTTAVTAAWLRFRMPDVEGNRADYVSAFIGLAWPILIAIGCASFLMAVLKPIALAIRMIGKAS